MDDRPIQRILLVPTEFELTAFERAGAVPVDLGPVELCGLGPIAAAARTAQLLGLHRPREVILFGIAGSYDVRLPVGEAAEFDSVRLDGLGAGSGADAVGLDDLGFPQWPGSDDTTSSPILDRLVLGGEDRGQGAGSEPFGLLTVCSASATPEQARRRRERFAGVVAEDMEGFGVALACALHRVPVRIFRGISNRAGDRNLATWDTSGAIGAVRDLLLRSLT